MAGRIVARRLASRFSPCLDHNRGCAPFDLDPHRGNFPSSLLQIALSTAGQEASSGVGHRCGFPSSMRSRLLGDGRIVIDRTPEPSAVRISSSTLGHAAA